MSTRRLAAVVIAFSLTITVLAFAGPKIEFDKESHDYGVVRYGKTAEAKFQFTNKGDETLVIKKLRSSCGCTKAVHGSSRVEPGGKSSIVASFDTEGLRAGRKRKTVYVHTNDPVKPIVKLSLYADVVKEIEVEPPSLARRLDIYGSEVVFPVKISNGSDKTLRVSGAEVNGSAQGIRLEPQPVIVKPGESAPVKIALKLANQDAWRYYMGHVILLTDNENEKRVDLRYFLQVGDAPSESRKSKQRK